jgi:hypothetical protein
MKISEISPAHPLTPDQAQLKNLRQRVKSAQISVTKEIKRQRIKKENEKQKKILDNNLITNNP